MDIETQNATKSKTDIKKIFLRGKKQKGLLCCSPLKSYISFGYFFLLNCLCSDLFPAHKTYAQIAAAIKVYTPGIAVPHPINIAPSTTDQAASSYGKPMVFSFHIKLIRRSR